MRHRIALIWYQIFCYRTVVTYSDLTTHPAVAEVLDAFGELTAAQRRLRGRDAHAPGGLSFAQLRVLTALEEEDGVPAGRLAERAGVTPATVTGMLDILEEQGVVTRVRSRDDRRVVLATLTEDGRRLRDRRRAEVRRVFEDALATLDPADLAAAPRVLRRLADVMEGL
jgi:DNA-binding MarR family transcriptional regulator